MNIKISQMAKVAVDQTYFWQPMESCPKGVKVQVLPKEGVARYEAVTSKSQGLLAWAPLPNKPEWLKGRA